VRAAAPGDPVVAALLEVVPDGYLVGGGVPQLLAHAALLAVGADEGPSVGGVPRLDGVRAGLREGPAAGTTTVSVAAGDRAGLLADCAGVLAAHGLDVLEARAFSVERAGLALDWFIVRPRSGGQPDRRRLVADLTRAADLDLAALVAARERHRDERPRPLAAPVRVDVAIDPRPGRTLVEVTAPDGPGLLSRLTRTLAAAGVDVAAARVETLGAAAHDAFLLRTDLDPSARADLAATLRAVAAG